MTRTTMLQPWDYRFDQVLVAWWQRINQEQLLTTELEMGTQPMKDWRYQQDQDVTYYYALDDWTFDELCAWAQARTMLLPYCQVQIITALEFTVNLDVDITHDMEIPGVWLVRIVKI